MPRNLEHPVWEVYDLLRTISLNIKYYSERASQVGSRNFWLELTLALTATGSAVGGLWFWENPTGAQVWKGLLVISAIVAVAKPLLKWTDKIQHFETLVGKYRLVERDIRKLVSDIQFSKHYALGHKTHLHKVLDQMATIAQEKGVVLHANKRLRAECQRAVAREFPSARFFVPG